jgi:hypothetical protein
VSEIHGAMHLRSYRSLTTKVADAGHSSANCVVPRIASGAVSRSTARYPKRAKKSFAVVAKR